MRYLPFLTLITTALGVASICTTAAAEELLPNLVPLPAEEISTQTSNGRINLVFSTTSWNSGAGPFELVIPKPNLSTLKQKAYQRIYSRDKSSRYVFAGFVIWHAAHNHFHFENYAYYVLRAVSASGVSDRTGQKTSFCIIDEHSIDLSKLGAPQSAQYNNCDLRTGPQGLSVGWGDKYDWYREGQSLDITGLPNGNYNLIIQIDPKNRVVEASDSSGIDDNNSTVTINLNNGIVTVMQRTSPGQAAVPVKTRSNK